jgi:hypothetical protein
MEESKSDELVRIAKRKVASIQEMIEYMKEQPNSKMKKSILGMLKSQIENINTSGGIISMNMRAEQFLAFQKFLLENPK